MKLVIFRQKALDGILYIVPRQKFDFQFNYPFTRLAGHQLIEA